MRALAGTKAGRKNKESIYMPKWKAGTSGNPSGRRPGSKSHVSRELERIVIGAAGTGGAAYNLWKSVTEK